MVARILDAAKSVAKGQMPILPVAKLKVSRMKLTILPAVLASITWSSVTNLLAVSGA